MLLLSRLARAVVSLWLIVTLVFVALRATGDPVLAVFDPDNTSQAALESYRQQWGYTGSVFQQYLVYVANVFQGHFGISNMSNRDALAVVLERLPATQQLVGLSALVMLAIGVPVGSIAAINAGGKLDRFVMAGSTVGFALPNFVLGLALILVFSVFLHLLPSNGIGSPEHL